MKQYSRNFGKNHNNNEYIASNNNNQQNNYRGSSRGQGCGRNRHNVGGPHFQVCGIRGHTVLNCRNRLNHAYQVEDYRSRNSATFGHYNKVWRNRSSHK